MIKWRLLAVVAGAVIALPAMAAGPTYRADVEPLLKKNCNDCHAAPDAPSMAEFKLDEEKYKKAKVGPRVDTYEHVLQLINGQSTGAFMRRLDDGTNPLAKGKPGNMYKYLGESDAERAANLKMLKEWVGEGGWNLNRMAARGDVPALTREQIDMVKVPY